MLDEREIESRIVCWYCLNIRSRQVINIRSGESGRGDKVVMSLYHLRNVQRNVLPVIWCSTWSIKQHRHNTAEPSYLHQVSLTQRCKHIETSLSLVIPNHVVIIENRASSPGFSYPAAVTSADVP